MLKPLFDNVLIEEEKVREETVREIVRPTQSKRHPHGKVIATGPGTKDKPMPLKPGDRVLFRQGGHVINDDGKEYLLMPIASVFGIAEDKKQIFDNHVYVEKYGTGWVIIDCGRGEEGDPIYYGSEMVATKGIVDATGTPFKGEVFETEELANAAARYLRSSTVFT